MIFLSGNGKCLRLLVWGVQSSWLGADLGFAVLVAVDLVGAPQTPTVFGPPCLGFASRSLLQPRLEVFLSCQPRRRVCPGSCRGLSMRCCGLLIDSSYLVGYREASSYCLAQPEMEAAGASAVLREASPGNLLPPWAVKHLPWPDHRGLHASLWREILFFSSFCPVLPHFHLCPEGDRVDYVLTADENCRSVEKTGEEDL